MAHTGHWYYAYSINDDVITIHDTCHELNMQLRQCNSGGTFRPLYATPPGAYSSLQTAKGLDFLLNEVHTILIIVVKMFGGFKYFP